MDQFEREKAEPVVSAKFFLSRLESLRGLAALMVAVGHCLIAFKLSPLGATISKLLLLLFNGRAAVSMFFVLSGYVLGLSLLRSEHLGSRGAGAFLTRRVFRILPALVAITSTFVILIPTTWNSVAGLNPVSDWLIELLPAKPGIGEFFQNIALFSHSLNEVTWTLQVEVLGSVLLLGLHLIHRRSSWTGTLGLTCILLGIAAVSKPYHHPWFHLFSFPLGYALCHVKETATRQVFRGWLGLAILGCSTICWLTARVVDFSELYSFAFEGIGAVGLLATILWLPSRQFFAFLDWSWVRFVGRISYSFYLVHPIVMMFTVWLWAKWFPAPDTSTLGLGVVFLFSAATLLIAAPLSWACFALVEAPLNRYGRTIASRIERSNSAVGD